MDFAIQSTSSQLPHHTAIILDGNGRWAERRGLPRWQGHRAGARAAGRIVETALELGLPDLTYFVFSSDNWRRDHREVGRLLTLLERALDGELANAGERGVRLSVIGRRDRLPGSLIGAIERAEHRSARGGRLHLRLAVDYSARHAIASASGLLEPADLAERIGRALHAAEPIPDVDLLIRTGGERRLSDFLLWEAAYAEILFLDLPWPDFGPRDLRGAVEEFARRDRRFGGARPSLQFPALQEVIS
ncbi:MAG: polyprenyl diphosphate synthase [Thermoanaerobaculia bacterium]